MATQLTLKETQDEYHRLKAERLESTAKERFQEETVATLSAMLKRERKILREVRKGKRKAEDDCERFRADHDLEV